MLKELIRTYRIIILIFLIILVLIAIRLFTGDHFKNGAEKNARPALSASNFIDKSHPDFSNPATLLVYLYREPDASNTNRANVLCIKSEDKILSQQILNRLRKSNGTIVLISDDMALSARAWMLLAQKGICNLYILSENNYPEKFKYEFQPDSINITEGLEFK